MAATLASRGPPGRSKPPIIIAVGDANSPHGRLMRAAEEGDLVALRFLLGPLRRSRRRGASRGASRGQARRQPKLSPQQAPLPVASDEDGGDDASSAYARTGPVLDVDCRTKVNFETPLAVACLMDEAEAAAVLLRHGADPNSEDRAGNTPLVYADHPGVVAALIRGGADVNVRDTETGETPLFLAYRREDERVARLLLDAGAQPNIPNHAGDRILDLVAARGDIPWALALLGAGGNVRLRGAGGQQPLHAACANDRLEMAELLLVHGADLEAKDAAGCTALMAAAATGALDACRLLLNLGVKLWAVDASGRRSAMHIAQASGHDIVVTLLETFARLRRDLMPWALPPITTGRGTVPQQPAPPQRRVAQQQQHTAAAAPAPAVRKKKAVEGGTSTAAAAAPATTTHVPAPSSSRPRPGPPAFKGPTAAAAAASAAAAAATKARKAALKLERSRRMGGEGQDGGDGSNTAEHPLLHLAHASSSVPVAATTLHLRLPSPPRHPAVEPPSSLHVDGVAALYSSSYSSSAVDDASHLARLPSSLLTDLSLLPGHAYLCGGTRAHATGGVPGSVAMALATARVLQGRVPDLVGGEGAGAGAGGRRGGDGDSSSSSSSLPPFFTRRLAPGHAAAVPSASMTEAVAAFPFGSPLPRGQPFAHLMMMPTAGPTPVAQKGWTTSSAAAVAAAASAALAAGSVYGSPGSTTARAGGAGVGGGWGAGSRGLARGLTSKAAAVAAAVAAAAAVRSPRRLEPLPERSSPPGGPVGAARGGRPALLDAAPPAASPHNRLSAFTDMGVLGAWSPMALPSGTHAGAGGGGGGGWE
jgi:ankyrin repeat protein